MTPVPSGCPRCGAHTRPGAQWCGLCHTSLRAAPVQATAPARVTVPQAAVDHAEASVSLQESPERPTAAASRGKHARIDPTEEPPPPPPGPGGGRRGVAAAESEDEVLLGADAMLALLAAESAKPLGQLSGRFDSTASRIGLMAGGMFLFAGLLFVVMAIIGSMI